MPGGAATWGPTGRSSRWPSCARCTSRRGSRPTRRSSRTARPTTARRTRTSCCACSAIRVSWPTRARGPSGATAPTCRSSAERLLPLPIAGRRVLVGAAPGPIELLHARPHALAAGLEIGEDLRVVRGEHTTAVHHEPAADPDAIDILRRRVVDDVLHGIAQGRHAPRRRLPQDEIRGGAGGDAAEVVAAQRAGAAERGGVEHVGGGRGRRVALDDLAADGGDRKSVV